MMTNLFSKNLKYLRKANKLSQEQLAEKLNVHHTAISKWENGTDNITLENMIKVANVLEVPLADLAATDMQSDSYSFDSLELLFSKNKDILTEDDKETIKFIIEKRKKEIDKQFYEN